MSRERKGNLFFIICIIVVCIIIIALLISNLQIKSSSSEYTIPNITTIVGTVLTIGALIFTIREQIRLKSISEAINQNNKNIQNELLRYSFGFNLSRCLKYVHDVKGNIQSNQAFVVLVRLTDLKECLIECKKIIRTKGNLSASATLEVLGAKTDKELTKQAIKSLWDNVTLQQEQEKQQRLNIHVNKVSGYITAIEIANYSLDGIKNKKEFISHIEGLGSYLNEINDLPIFQIKEVNER